MVLFSFLLEFFIESNKGSRYASDDCTGIVLEENLYCCIFRTIAQNKGRDLSTYLSLGTLSIICFFMIVKTCLFSNWDFFFSIPSVFSHTYLCLIGLIPLSIRCSPSIKVVSVYFNIYII